MLGYALWAVVLRPNLADAAPQPGPRLPAFLHFGVGLGSPEAVRAFEERLSMDGVEIVGSWDEPDYVSVKFRDPDGYILEASWEPDD